MEQARAAAGRRHRRAGGIHAITQETNLWFDREVGVLERDARTFAAAWASKGLPRHDVARTAPLEVEQFLAGRCAETFRQWVDRVRVTMRDRIAREAQSLGDKLVELRASTTRIERLESEITGIDARVQELSAETKENAAPVGFEPIVPGWLFFWFFAIALTIVEFFANFPVFRLLLPLKSALAKAAEDAAQDTISGGLVGGLGAADEGDRSPRRRALRRARRGALSHLVRKNHRRIRSRPRRAQTQGPAARRDNHSRAFGANTSTALLGSLLGVAAVLTFLYLSRASIASVAASASDGRQPRDATAQERSAADSAGRPRCHGQIRRGDSRADADARDSSRRSRLRDHGAEQQHAAVLPQPRARLRRRGPGISDLSPNSCAMERQSTRRSSSFERIGNRSRQTRTRRFDRAARRRSQARASIGRVEHLMTASPLAEWVAKADRLEVVIPLFRGENARLRNMDPASILAFAGKPSLSLPTLEAERGFPEPTDFARLKEEFEVCRRDFGAVTRANSDQPQRRELGMMVARLALGCVSFALGLSALGCGESAGAKVAPPADESVHRRNRSVGQSLRGSAERFAAASGQPGRETAQRR